MKFKHEKLPENIAKMRQSAGGREYIEKYRERHQDEFLQPSDRKFDKIYSKDQERKKRISDSQERRSKDEWGDVKERQEYDKMRKVEPGYRKAYQGFKQVY